MHKRYYDIDVLRFLAAASVMSMHYLVRGFWPGDQYSPVFYGQHVLFAKYNYLAVNLFFMISGFVILMSAESGNAKAFLQSRFLRLYPAYWFCCSLSFLLTLTFANEIFKQSIPRYVLNMTMLNGLFGIGSIDGVYWTLLVELKFYTLILLVLLTNKIKQIEPLLAGWLLISALQIFLKSELLTNYAITNFASFFIAGCIFYRISKSGFTLYRTATLLASVPVGLYYEFQEILRRRQHFPFDFSEYTAGAICIAFYFLFLAILRRKEVSVKYAEIASVLGKISYPLYLMHFTVGMVLYNLIGNRVNKWLLFCGISALIIFISYGIARFVERPFSRYLKSRLFGANIARSTLAT